MVQLGWGRSTIYLCIESELLKNLLVTIIKIILPTQISSLTYSKETKS